MRRSKRQSIEVVAVPEIDTTFPASASFVAGPRRAQFGKTGWQSDRRGRSQKFPDLARRPLGLNLRELSMFVPEKSIRNCRVLARYVRGETGRIKSFLIFRAPQLSVAGGDEVI